MWGMCRGACGAHDLFEKVLIFEKSIEGMLRSQPGIHSVKVALLAERGVVEYDPSMWTAEKVAEVCSPIWYRKTCSTSCRKSMTLDSMLSSFHQVVSTLSLCVSMA